MPPVFIIANPRSGSSMLRLMLTCHRELHVPPECGFVMWLRDAYGDWSEASFDRLDAFLDALYQARKFETWEVPRGELRSYLLNEARPNSYSALTASVYEFHARQQGKAPIRWGDKNNYYLNHIPEIRSLFPDCLFLHIVRDARDVACSYRELSERELIGPYAPELPARVEESASDWQTNVVTIEQSFQSLSRDDVYRVHFEDLVQDTEASLQQICAFLGVDFDPAMLAFHETNNEESLEPEATLQWKRRTLEPLDESRVGRYQSELTAHQITTVERIAREGLLLYGYLDR